MTERLTERAAQVASINAARDVATMLMLLAAAVYLSATEHGELAATALGGALSYALPSARLAGGGTGGSAPPLALGLIFGGAAAFL